MNSKRTVLYLLMTICLITTNASCSKNEDIVTKNVAVRGNLRNDCTGTGFSGVSVSFYTRKTNSGISYLTTSTDLKGNFSFTGLDIHSSNDYAYGLFIDTYVRGSTEFDGIGPEDINKEQLSTFFQLSTLATFNNCPLRLPPGISINAPDTFTLTFIQNVLHFYEPKNTYMLTLFPRDFQPPSKLVNIGGYPMGWWNIALDKTKSGIHTIIHDSIYLRFGEDTTYIIPW